MLSRDDIRKAIVDGSIKIYPFEERSLTGIGYNLSTTNFAFSINRGILLEIRSKVNSSGSVNYVEIPPHDTVLFYSREYIEVDNTIAGTLHSKVSRVCEGLGHISTTLDPTWRGQLIIAVTNQTSKEVEFVLNEPGGNVMTLLFHRLDTPVTGPNVHDNNKGRCDLLLKYFTSGGAGARDREKYYALEKFVVGPFASSLNGDDSFLGSEVPPDAFAKRVHQLQALRDRLREESAFFRNRMYLDGSQSVYKVSGSIEDDELIRSCALYRVEPCEQFFEEIPLYGRKGEDSALEAIGRCLRIISFELETIEHSRRIEWQNKEVEKFASAESEWSKFKRKKERRERWRKEWPSLTILAALIMGAIALGIVLYGCFAGDADPSMALIITPVLSALIGAGISMVIAVRERLSKNE